MKAPQIKLKRGVLEELMEEKDINKKGLSLMLGISLTQLYRIMDYKHKVGECCIARILVSNPNKNFNDFFYIE